MPIPNLFKRKQAATAPKPERRKTPMQQGRDFIQDSKEFEKSEDETLRKQGKYGLYVGAAGSMVAIAAVFGMVAMQPLVRTQAYILLKDKETGQIEVAKKLDQTTLANDENTNREQLTQYVTAREGYDWHLLQDMYDKTILMSGDEEANRYAKIYEGDKGLDKVLGNKYRSIIKVSSVTFIGEKTAQIRYTKETRPTNPSDIEEPVVENKIATVAFGYENPPLKENERSLSPVGFKVYSFTPVVEKGV